MKAGLGSNDYLNVRPPRPEGVGDATGHVDAPAAGAGSVPLPDDVTRQTPAFVPPSSGSVPPPDTQDKPRKGRLARGILGILGALGVGCIGTTLISFALGMAVLTVGLSSCVASCSDSPIGDSREDAAFIASLDANDRDLETFDALSGTIAHLLARTGDGDGEAMAGALREQVEAGRWPKGDESEAHEPRVWVRIAELSQDAMERESGERWQIVDFAYPFPSNDPIPWPATRDEGTSCMTRLVCTSGADEGQYATVHYYRWANPARFETDLGDERERRAEAEAFYQQVVDTQLLGDRSFLLDDNELYVWASGPDDELCDIEVFMDVARVLCGLLGNYGDVTLLAADTPIYLRYEPLSTYYGNDLPNLELPLAEAQRTLQCANYIWSFDHAAGDVLLSIYQRQDEELEAGQLTGELAPDQSNDYHVPSLKPTESCQLDEDFGARVAASLGMDDPEDVIAITGYELRNYYEESGHGDDDWEAWIVLPRGAVPETPEGFCAAVNGLIDLAWRDVEPVEGRRTGLYVRVYVIDPEGIYTSEGAPCSFGDLRAQLAEHPDALGSYGLDVQLGVMGSVSLWDGETEPTFYYVEKSDVGGPIARSREWRYGSGR